jgi:hypothetical protein
MERFLGKDKIQYATTLLNLSGILFELKNYKGSKEGY